MSSSNVSSTCSSFSHCADGLRSKYEQRRRSQDAVNSSCGQQREGADPPPRTSWREAGLIRRHAAMFVSSVAETCHRIFFMCDFLREVCLGGSGVLDWQQNNSKGLTKELKIFSFFVAFELFSCFFLVVARRNRLFYYCQLQARAYVFFAPTTQYYISVSYLFLTLCAYYTSSKTESRAKVIKRNGLPASSSFTGPCKVIQMRLFTILEEVPRGIGTG